MSYSTYIMSLNDNLTSQLVSDYETYNYSVMVLKDSDYNDISDIKSEVISYYETKTNENKLLVEHVNKLGKVIAAVDIENNPLNLNFILNVLLTIIPTRESAIILAIIVIKHSIKKYKNNVIPIVE